MTTRTVGPIRLTGAAAALLFLSACAASPAATRTPPPPSAPTTTSAETGSAVPDRTAGLTAEFTSVLDGDTVETSAGTVRIIGIDTPEQGECGHDEASASIGRLLVSGASVTLSLPPGENDRDAYGRLIRYVTTAGGDDIGLIQLEAGHAVARYDSRDGYPAHPKQELYRAAQIAHLDTNGKVVTIYCSQAVDEPPVVDDGAHWWEKYTSCTKLKKNTVGDPTGPFARDDAAQAEIYDWFANRTGNRGDGDGDGLACE